MKQLTPLNAWEATVTLPGSKYIANRALLIAALATGQTVLHNVPENDDIAAALCALEQLGISVTHEGTTVTLQGGTLKQSSEEINVNESGTLLRFITALSSLVNGSTTITGSRRIQERPVTDLLDSLNTLGVNSTSNKGCAPITIESSGLQGGEVKVKGSISSQYLSALLLVAPYADKDVEIVVEGELVSKRYVDLTINLMDDFGVSVQRRGYERFIIEAGSRYTAREYTITGDWSSASYFMAAAALIPGKITLRGMDLDSVHGERQFIDVLRAMGCETEEQGGNLILSGPSSLYGVEVNMSSMPDTVQTLAVLAGFATTPTTITGISHLRHKESDRISDTATELKKLGVQVETTDDQMDISPSSVHGGIIETHQDHRMAMSFALAGLKVAGVQIQNAHVVSKSFPTFWEMLVDSGIEVKDV